MRGPQDDVYVTLQSNVQGGPENKPCNNKTILRTPLKLNAALDLTLLETLYPHHIRKFKATTLVLIGTDEVQVDQPDSDQSIPAQTPVSQSITADTY